MNTALKKFCLVIASSALLLAGCSKKPKRPDPSATMIGPAGGGSVNPSDVTTPADLTTEPGLGQREEFDMNGQLRGKFEAVLFDFDRSDIKQAERAKLDEAAKYLKEHADQRLLLEGHCDWRGTAEYNLGLGDRRANAAKRYLLSLGVTTDKIETLSKGSLDAAKNADDATMAKDRRADIVILKK